MSTRQNSALSLKPEDILFVFARHKKKLITAVILGLAAATWLFFAQKPLYVSRAKLMVKYVMETRTIAPVGGVRQIKDPDQGAQSLINSELEILTSQDLFKQIVTEIGTDRIMGKTQLTNTFNAAVTVVVLGLKVQVTPRSEVINITFQHGDPDVARDVLSSLIRLYQQKHSEVHRTSEGLNYLAEQTDAIGARLLQTEAALRKAMNDAGINSLPEARLEMATRITDLRRAIAEQEAELASEAAMHGWTASTNRASTNATAVAAVAPAAEPEAVPATNTVQAPLPATATRYDAELYNQLVRQLTQLKAREIELLATFTATSAPVQQARNQINELNKLIEGMAPPVAAPNNLGGQMAVPFMAQAFTQPLAPSRVPGITARLQALRDQLRVAMDESKRIDGYETSIHQMERQKELDEINYKYFSTALEQAKIDNNLSTGMLNNITVIQSPSIANRATKDQMKVVAAGGVPICLILLYGFIFELLMPKGFARPKDVEASLRLPLIGVVPVFGRNGHKRKRLKAGDDKALVKGTNGSTLEIAPWDESDPMLPYYEALRDRVVMSYEGDPHKPKIVGLTSCNAGAGVSRLATGLAAALSRDVERDVLYIGLEKSKVALTAFSKGRPSAVESSNSQSAEDWSEQSMQPVRDNLMSLATTGRNLVGASAVQSFCDLIPRLKGCNYDYIIFDLPPLSQTSGSLRLASQMERTVLVVESDVTPREKTERAAKLLTSAHANVSVVLNKAHSYGANHSEEEI